MINKFRIYPQNDSFSMCSCERNKFSSCLQLEYPSFVLNGYIIVSNSEHKTDSCQFPPKYWMKTHAYCTQKNTFKLTCLCSASPFKGKNKVKVNKSLNIKSEKYPNRLNGTNIDKIQRNNFLKIQTCRHLTEYIPSCIKFN